MDEIIWLDEALQDLDDIGSYIALDNVVAAEQVVRRIVEAVALLAWHPKIGRLTADEDTRRLVISGTPYIAFYRLRERIEILAIFHASRKWPEHL
ncbi:type II toxin-antitoxin system RelE/ParE family toxin [Rhizobium sp. LC145]|uniref:type II toxin-antitoxin system RelE/ParE family toxin n=1 Tax=Rhizobium sp. LC145 TaxID=1120688 RepID=UPI00062A18D2|nr:type II toxin-antitoxin system RelE/ParE family toxin [Rhizobium sp. LC145]KKX28266.1 toxin Y4kP [Rhizobium sp. LC145]TKT58310.1 type II toxin-antitoxin system RelE/ParE family toxin [Rhizobiaceae bacterium LC148]